MWVYPFEQHKQWRGLILELINKMPNGSINNGVDAINKTDWYLPKETKRNYLNFFYDLIHEQMTKICADFKCKQWEIHNGWFQQYEKNNTHKWHTHSHSNMSAVYYLELPKQELQTEFIDGSKPKVKEGDILFFPAYKLHRSPVNKTKERKTIISFNCCFWEWDEKNDNKR